MATSVEWRIDGVLAKLKANCGFPLLSPSFDAGELRGLRIMFCPGSKWAEQERRRQRKRKPAVAAPDSAGLFGAVRLKAVSDGAPSPLELLVAVGSHRQGPCKCDFSEHPIQGCGLASDWLEQLEEGRGALTLRVELR